MATALGTSLKWIASSLVMIRLRSMVMPAALRRTDPVVTMISLRVHSVCLSPSKRSTVETRPPPADPPLAGISRAAPLIHSILFFLNRNSIPLASPSTMRFLRAWNWARSMPTDACPELAEESPIVTPHSLAC